jgi:hypothetical protein
MKSRKFVLHGIAAAIILAGVIFAGCKGDQGPAGPAGRNPAGGPIITAIQAAPDSVGGGGATQLLVAAYDPNGDSLSYVWSASAGVFTTPYASTTVWTAPQESGLITLHVTVTANGQSASDSARVGVNMRVPTAGVAWLGNDAQTCGQCHASIATGWLTTNHANAFTDLVASGEDTNNYCLQCHTVGFDDTYDHNGNLLAHGPDSTGYDNLRTANLTGVQCEDCHGQMGPGPLNHAPQPLTNIINGNKCDQCHDQNAEWAVSRHGTAVSRNGGTTGFIAEWGGSNCNPCHVSEGFIANKDPNFASTGLPLANGVTCATCHDPHNKTNEMQLRTVADVTQSYGGEDNPDGRVISGLGNGQLCAQCHHARSSRSSILTQITTGSAHPGPHHSPQADMVSGYGDWELPGPVNRTNQHNFAADTLLQEACASCHMWQIPRGQTGGPFYGHDFEPKIEMCQQCHSSATSFDIAGVQTHTMTLLDSLGGLLPHDSTGAVRATIDTVNWTADQRAAGYTYFFVESDGSKGVHNAAYTTSILTNAINSLSPAPMPNN